MKHDIKINLISFLYIELSEKNKLKLNSIKMNRCYRIAVLKKNYYSYKLFITALRVGV